MQFHVIIYSWCSKPDFFCFCLLLNTQREMLFFYIIYTFKIIHILETFDVRVWGTIRVETPYKRSGWQPVRGAFLMLYVTKWRRWCPLDVIVSVKAEKLNENSLYNVLLNVSSTKAIQQRIKPVHCVLVLIAASSLCALKLSCPPQRNAGV